jgi:hypothetical protein
VDLDSSVDVLREHNPHTLTLAQQSDPMPASLVPAQREKGQPKKKSRFDSSEARDCAKRELA